MLKIYLGNMEKAIYHPPTYFDNQYEDEWITKELSIRMIKEVDKSDVINSSLIQSPVLGTISVKELSGSVWFELSEDRFSAENDKRYTHEEVFANLRRKING